MTQPRVAIDGGSRSDKNAVAVRPLVDNPSNKFKRVLKFTPKKGLPSLFKTGPQAGTQKHVWVPAHPKQWEVIEDTVYKLFKGPLRNSDVRIEPFVGSYYKDKDAIVQCGRDNGVNIDECDIGLTARARIRLGIPKDETTDLTDAILIWFGNDLSFGPMKLSSEKIHMDRTNVKEALERSEESQWTDTLAKEALAIITPEYITSEFGADLATPVFIVTAYAAAKAVVTMPHNSRRDFDRYCGLNARARRGKKGVGGLISSNLTHFNDNPLNKKAARRIFSKVKSNAINRSGPQGSPR